MTGLKRSVLHPTSGVIFISDITGLKQMGEQNKMKMEKGLKLKCLEKSKKNPTNYYISFKL